MPDVRLRHPNLVRPGDPPTIVGHRCQRCGRTAFPPDPYGCEACGAAAEQLSPAELAASGAIHAVATVHRHHHPRPETPFTVATIVLDGGVTLKGVLASGAGRRDPAGAAVGDRVVGVLVPWETDDDGTEVVDLRFRPGRRRGGLMGRNLLAERPSTWSASASTPTSDGPRRPTSPWGSPRSARPWTTPGSAGPTWSRPTPAPPCWGWGPAASCSAGSVPPASRWPRSRTPRHRDRPRWPRPASRWQPAAATSPWPSGSTSPGAALARPRPRPASMTWRVAPSCRSPTSPCWPRSTWRPTGWAPRRWRRWR